jgi:DNA polymerase-3 subunit alpha
LDSFGYRAQLLAGLDTAYSEISARKAEEEAGQASLFGTGDASLERKDPGLPNVPDWPEQERLKREKEALGFFISGHPLDRYADVVRAFDHVNTANLKDHLGRPLDLACVVTKVQRQISRRDSSEWGKVTVEDFHGTATVLAFKDNWQKYKEVLQQDAIVLLSGKVSGRERDEEDPPIFLDDALLLESVSNSGQLALQIELPAGAELDEDVFARAKEVLVAHPGTAPVELRLGSDNGVAAPVLRSRTLKADPSHETIEALQKMFGKARVRLVRVGDGKSVAALAIQ